MSILKKIFLENYQEEKVEPKVVEFVQPTTSTTPTPSFVQPREDKVEVNPKIVEMVQNFLKEINKPGFDFMEFHEMTESLTDKSQFELVKNTLNTLKVSYSKESLIQDGNYYLAKLSEIIEGSIKNGNDKASKIDSQFDNLRLEKSDLEGRLAVVNNELQNLELKVAAEKADIQNTIKDLKVVESMYKDKINKTIQKINNYL